MTAPSTTDAKVSSGPNRLLVLLHAYTLNGKSMNAVRRAAMEAKGGRFANAEVLTPEFPYSRVFSRADPTEIARKLIAQIDEVWEKKCRETDGAGFESITFIGHSAGALMARKVYVYACGANEDAPFEAGISPGGRPWAGRVDRIVLLAGMNRGWQISHHMSVPLAVQYRVGTMVGNIAAYVSGRPPFIFSIRRGASFLTQLRLQWLSMRRNAKAKGVGNALTVQLLGTVDDRVGPDDNLDLYTGGDFFYLEVRKTGHSNVIELDDLKDGPGRREVFCKALVGSEEELRENSVQPLDTPLELNQQDVKKVVFVIHGIRDLGYWTRKIAQRVQVLARKKEVGFRAVTSTYGYFAMLPFIWPSTRRAKVEWLMDEYAQARARYPNAKFCYVGHSNGTYMLASALQEYPCCQFEHVVFAGSVVRTDYRWDRFRENGQVKAVLNYVATSDWVVAFFPKAFELLHWQDLGSAGHDGFLAIPAEGAAGQIEYIHGSHGAALVEENWDAIADFVIEGRLPGDAPPRNLLARKRNGAIAFCGRISPLLWAVGLSIVLLLAWLILYGRIGWPGDWAPSWGRAVGLVLYAWAIKTVVTRV